MATGPLSEFGSRLRRWRESRRVSQLRLALDAGVSPRHLSFIETGRARPSREMVLLLSTQLDLPLREQNALLLAAGFAPVFDERPFDAPELSAVREVVDLILQSHEPFPALAASRSWDVLRSNRGASLLVEGVSPALLEPPMNVYRLSLHPDGMRSRVTNFEAFASAMMSQLRRDAAASASPELHALLEEIEEYPGIRGLAGARHEHAEVALPLRLRTSIGELAFITTIAVFGTPLSVTVAELAIESFFPADQTTARLLRDRDTRAS